MNCATRVDEQYELELLLRIVGLYLSPSSIVHPFIESQIAPKLVMLMKNLSRRQSKNSIVISIERQTDENTLNKSIHECVVYHVRGGVHQTALREMP